MYKHVDLGKRILLAREAAGLTQQAVADHFEVDKSTVCRWERGEHDPGTERLAVLAQMFNVPPAQLAFGDGNAPARGAA